MSDAIGEGQQISVGDHGPVGRLASELPQIGFEEISAGSPPPKLLGEVPGTPADVNDGPAIDPTAVRLNLIDGIASEKGVAVLGIVLLT
ncbi:hypothetical protein GCM10017771_10480 [Streptomyces capitiformicae]|uniref:Uncharacterized protein n=1 Tax=Streptomyces capitiformicae TaxID=2014920 RepID=A0A919GFJ9_9ACTN|nr:hypothetical protein GCM10017771_10480 [Streptomyces capitiformicae]